MVTAHLRKQAGVKLCRRQGRRNRCSSTFCVTSSGQHVEVAVVGAGIGGLTAASLLAWQGKNILVLESHYRPGGAAHGFTARTEEGQFAFDTGPSFYAGLDSPGGLNPLASVLAVLDEPLDTVQYNPLGTFHIGGAGDLSTTMRSDNDMPGQPLQRYCSLDALADEIAQFSSQGALELRNGAPFIRRMCDALRGVPPSALRADIPRAVPSLARYAKGFAPLGQFAPFLGEPTSKLLSFLNMNDPFLRRLVDLECFLLSGMPADSTPAAEFAAVFGESDTLGRADFPSGGSEEIANALVRGLHKHGGDLRLNAHVARIDVDSKSNTATGVTLMSGEHIAADRVITNASMWDTFGDSDGGIVQPADGSSEPQSLKKERDAASSTSKTPSFIHLHAGLKHASGNPDVGHHVAVNDITQPLDQPGNVRMVSVPTTWDSSLAPDGCQAAHVYSMDHFEGWEEVRRNQKGGGRQMYEAKKSERCSPLWDALELALPGARNACVLEKTASPLTHKFWLRRSSGTYGPAIASPTTFPAATTSVKNLLRCGDSAAPGIGVPAVAGSGLLAANTLSTMRQHSRLMDAFDDAASR